MGQHLFTSREVNISATRSHLTGRKPEDRDVRVGWGWTTGNREDTRDPLLDYMYDKTEPYK